MDKTNLPPLPRARFTSFGSEPGPRYTAEQMHEYAARAVREAGADGMVLVPREPTQEMLIAGAQFTNRNDWVPDHTVGTATIWRAMVSVSQGEP